MPLNSVDGVDDSAILFCYGDEYIKILGNEDDFIRKSLFEDNVRDFQGSSSINGEIQQTIKYTPELFALLNNGITIVCDGYTQRNKAVTIRNPQIINGCQSSHVIFNNKNSVILRELPLVIKIIATTNGDVVNKIVRAANRQNIVYEEAYETTREFHKSLEQFFLSMNLGDEKVYYERRAKQYLNNPQVQSNQKFGIKIVTQAYTGMFLEQVHETHRHETVLIKKFQGKIFDDNQSFYPYFIATASYYRLESLVRAGKIELQEFSAYRYHLLLVSKWLRISKFRKIDYTNSIDSDAFCKYYLREISDENLSLNLFKESVEFMKSAKDTWVKKGKSKYSIKDNKDFTAHLQNLLSKDEISQSNQHSILNGKIDKVIKHQNGLYFGFISYGTKGSIYYDSTSLPNTILLAPELKGKK